MPQTHGDTLREIQNFLSSFFYHCAKYRSPSEMGPGSKAPMYFNPLPSIQVPSKSSPDSSEE